MYNESDKAIHFPLPQTDIPIFKFLSHTHTHNHNRRISDDYTLRAPTSALRPKKSLKLFIKSFFVLELKKKGVAERGRRGAEKKGEVKRGRQPHSHPSLLLLYYSSASSHPSFSMLMEDKIGHRGIGWCSLGD